MRVQWSRLGWAAAVPLVLVDQPLAEHWNGTGWTAVPAPRFAPGAMLIRVDARVPDVTGDMVGAAIATLQTFGLAAARPGRR